MFVSSSASYLSIVQTTRPLSLASVQITNFIGYVLLQEGSNSPQVYVYLISPLRRFVEMNNCACMLMYGLFFGTRVVHYCPNHRCWRLLIQGSVLFKGGKQVDVGFAAPDVTFVESILQVDMAYMQPVH